MALTIKDGNAASTTLKTTVASAVHTPHHNVDASALPTGASTEAGLTLARTAIAAVETAVNAGTLAVTSLVSGVLTNTDGLNTAVIAAQGVGIITYLTDVTITNSSAAAVVVEIKTGTVAKWIALIPATSGITHRFASPLVGVANTAWNVDAVAATTTIYVTFSGFKR